MKPGESAPRPPTAHPTITGLYAVLIDTAHDGEVVAYAETKGGCIPLVASLEDAPRLAYLKDAARALAKIQKRPVRLTVFLRQTVVEVYRP